MTTSETPIVRHLLVCREVVVESGGRGVDVRGLVHAVVRLPGESFPLRQRLALFVMLANGRGEHDFAFRFSVIERGEDGRLGEDATIATSPPRRIDLGQDPTVVHGIPVPSLDVVFSKPGQYTFELLCDGRVIASEHLEAR